MEDKIKKTIPARKLGEMNANELFESIDWPKSSFIAKYLH